MGIPARAARPLVALAIAAASLGCIAHPAYAENATAAVVSDDGSHIVVDVDLNGGASDVGSDRQGAEKGSQGESVSDTETDKTMKAFEGLMTFNVIIITTAFYYMFLPFISAMAMILLLNELLDRHGAAVFSPDGWTEPVSRRP